MMLLIEEQEQISGEVNEMFKKLDAEVLLSLYLSLSPQYKPNVVYE